MAINVAGLSNYVKDNVDQLISRSMYGQKFQQHIVSRGGNVQDGIKTSERIHLLSNDVYFAADSGCGFTASGDATITARSITVGAVKINQSFCPKTLNAKATQLLLKKGSFAEGDSATIEQLFAEDIVGRVAEQVEVALFQGDTDSGNPNLARWDGLLKIASVANGAVQANSTTYFGTPATSYTTSNIRTAVMAVIKAFPLGTKTATDRVVAIGSDLFELYVQSYVDANLFHFKPEDMEAGEVTIPGTAVKLVAYPGLNGTNKIMGFRWSNIWLGTDLKNEEEDFKFWIDGSDMETVKMKMAFKLGIQVAYVNEVVRFDLA
jgi:hypothetical protein